MATQHHSLNAPDGARLEVVIDEPADATPSTPTVVMAHGWTLDHRSWSPVVDALNTIAPSSVRTIRYDQRGHGSSTLASGKSTAKNQTVRALGDDMAAVINKFVPLESPLVLAGHSMGGMTIMAFAGTNTALLKDRVKGVVLVATAAGDLTGLGLPGEAIAMKLLARLPVRAGFFVRPNGQRKVAFGDDARDEDVQAATQQVGGTRLSTTGAFYGALQLHNEYEALGELNGVPVIILAGSKDKLTPVRHAHKLNESMPNSDLRVLEGSGHMITYERPREAADAILELINS